MPPRGYVTTIRGTDADLDIAVTNKPNTPAMSPWGDVEIELKNPNKTNQTVKLRIYTKEKPDGSVEYIHTKEI